MQLDFFDIDSRAIKEEEHVISWSPSKMNTAKQCSRRLYYQYYGSKKSKAKNDPDKERLEFLANFSNKSLVAGEIAHAVIASYFRKAKIGELWTLDRLLGFAFHILRESVQYSKDVKAGKPLQSEYPPSILKEIYYGLAEENTIAKEIKEKLEANLKGFVSSTKFEHLRKGGSSYSSVVEEKAKFELVKGIKIDGVIDLAFQDGDVFRITDWKTGKSEDEDTSLQLLTYALWAAKKRNRKDSVIIEKAYLAEDKLENLEYSDVHLERARVRIIQDAEILRELHDFGIEGNSFAFSKCNKPRICMLCPFQEVCDKNNIKLTMETNIKIVEFGDRLNLTVKRIKLVGERLTDEQMHRACTIVGRQFNVAAIPLTDGDNQFLLIEVHDNILVKTLNVDDWVINLEPTKEISRLSVSVKKEQRQIADLYKKSLLIQIENKLGLWTLDSPRIFYEKRPFTKSDLAKDLSSPVSDIDAYRRYEISETFVEGVGLGFSVGIGTAFFSNLSVDDYYSSNLDKRLKTLLGRQKEQKGTLLYDGPKGRLKCYFEMYKSSVTLDSAPAFIINGKTFNSPFDYFSKVHPTFKVSPKDRAALVSFPGMSKKVYVPANRLYVRVMNEMVDYDMSQVDKILPGDRMKLIGDLWTSLGETPFGKNYVKVKDGFYQPASGNSGVIDLPPLLFGKEQLLPPPINRTKDDYRQHFRSRKEYLNKFGCYYVPPAMHRTIYFVYPESVDDRLRENFAKGICERVKTLTNVSVTPAIVTYQDYLNGIHDLQSNFEAGMVVFIFEDTDPTIYFNIRYELKNWKIKRVTKYQLQKKYKGLNDFKDGRFAKGEKNWNSFIEINTYDVIQQLGCLPYNIEPKLNYEMQLMIDVSDKSSHIALSLVMYKAGMYVPIFDSLIKPKTDTLKETINPVFLERYLVELFTKNKTLIGKHGFKSMLVLRDGKNCGEEYEALQSAIDKLKKKGVLDEKLAFSLVEYHKSTLKEIRLFEKRGKQYFNVCEGSYFFLDKSTSILATTGCGTLNQGTAAPVMLKSLFGDCDLLKVTSDVFVTSQLNFSSPSVAQRLTFAAKRADEQLKDRIAQEVIRIK